MKRPAALGMPLAAALFALLLCGCDTLPAGDPPPGPLADNTPPAGESPVAVHNRRVTALISCSLQSGLRELAVADDAAARVAADAARVAGFALLPEDGKRPVLSCGDRGIVLVRPDGTELWRCE